MRILLSNDDGIFAPGLRVLERAARTLSDDVWVVAPESEQSATSHSLTLHQPLRVRRISPRRYAVSGTPTDCVYLAINRLMADRRPALVLSGVNRGSNVGEDVTYSGTVAAAMEAALLGVPAIAFSQVYEDGQSVKWETAETWVPRVVERLLKVEWPERVLMNVNFPNFPADKVLGIRAARQALEEVEDLCVERVDPRGRPYFWVGMAPAEKLPGKPGSDLRAVNQGYVSVTPLHLDLTHHPTLRRLRNALT
ncbi:MAG: 5'/3'-nucleotidase SurE [Alphaproteobacteria bacterium]